LLQFTSCKLLLLFTWLWSLSFIKLLSLITPIEVSSRRNKIGKLGYWSTAVYELVLED
jgi:hypothetical protein